MKIVDKMLLIESVAQRCNSIVQIEMLLRYYIAKDILKLEINEELQIHDVYEELDLDNTSSIFEVVNKLEYQQLFNLCIERYKEINNPYTNIETMKEYLEVIRIAGDKLGNKEN